MAVNIIEISSPSSYSPDVTTLLPPDFINAVFNPSIDYIEYVITTPNNSFKTVYYNYNSFSFPTNGTVLSNNISSIEIDPELDITSRGFNNGEYNVYYNFYQNQLQTSQNNKNFFIKEISADRTELKLGFINNVPVVNLDYFKSYTSGLTNYFNDFYLNFGDNILAVANNFDYDPNTYDILINLYQPLPSNIGLNYPLWIVTKIADTLAFNIQFTPEVVNIPITTFDIKGPNFNLPIKDQVNNSSQYSNYQELLNNNSSTSYQQIISYLNEKNIDISVDYTDFLNFIHFSSAQSRLENFFYKVQLIEQYNSDLTTLSTVLSSSISSSSAVLGEKINNIIKNFDGYEYYLYYESGSNTYPKNNSTPPYSLLNTTSSQVLTWLGSDSIQSIYYGGQILSASLYDQNNQDYLINTIPEYLRDDSQNEPYKLFVDMIGQHYDNIWIYYKDVTNRYNGDNRLDFGISKDLVAEALKSFGVKIYQNNFTTENLYSSFLGYGSGSMGINLSPTGSDLITNYITASQNSQYIPIDDVNKEIYKRIYHNLPYLAKTKGTIPGLRALINCFGVPDTVLRISEFGGRDKDTSTYDYFDQQFNYAAEASASSIIRTPWIPNSVWSSSINTNKASSVQFRFKTSDFDTGSNYQLWGLSTSTTTFNSSASLVLKYSGSGLTTGSYSGSTVDSYYQHAYLTFYPKINDIVNTASIYLPFFNHNWWSVMINKFGDTYTLHAGDKLYYDGYDGNQIGYLSSSSITLANTLWTGSQTSVFLSSSVSIGGTTYNRFTGSLQEIRYWVKTGSVDSFKDYVMNPQSIDYSGEVLYDDYLFFRLPLGGDLYTGSVSVHPRATGSWAITSSFAAPTNATLTNVTFKPNIETRFLNSPIIGLRGRVTDKIQIISGSYPTGSVLSQYTSMKQSYPSLSSESPDVNLLEVAFSPQNEINDDIIDSLGYFNIGEYIGDPRQISSSATSYPDLNTLSNNFFQKYFDTYDLTDYVRLIKYFDNSLFKMIKDFVPARTSLTTGVVIKQHLLERNKYPQPKVDNTQYQNLNVYSSSLGLSSSFNYGEDLTYEGTIDTAFMSGGTGGTFDQYNILESYQSYPFTVVGSNFTIDPETPINYFAVSSSVCTITTNTPINDNFSWDPVTGEIITYFYGKIKLFAFGTNSPVGNSLDLYFSSSQNNIVATNTVSNSIWVYNTNVIDCSYGERFSLWIADGGSGPNTSSIQFGLFNIYPYSNQTWTQNYTGSTGVSTIIHSTQDEFYNGELPGSEYVVTNGELNPDNESKYPTTLEIRYTPTLYLSNVTSIEDFLTTNTSPNQGEIYLWFDTGSTLQPGPPQLPQ
jgi:hypothetical protein